MITLDTTAVLEFGGTRIRVDPDRLHATVGGTDIDATSLIELRARLASALYAQLHIRNPGIAEAAPAASDALIEALIAAIPHRTVDQPVTPCPEAAATVQGEERRVVTIGGVRVLVPPAALLRTGDGTVAGVRLPSWRPRTTPGYLLALGPVGFAPSDRIARLYITADDADEALAVWRPLLAALDGVPHQAKALSDGAAYPRADALVAYVPAEWVDEVADRIRALLAERPPAATATSAFARRITDRLAQAEDPADARPSYRGLSFGQHRSRVLADALIRAGVERIPAAVAWAQDARAAGFDPEEPGRTIPA